MIDSDSAL